MDEKKENTFAKEVQLSKVSPAEEMNRNQAVHLVTLRSEKKMLACDVNHLGLQMTRIKGRRQLIASMPDCECKQASMSIIDQRIEKLEQAIEASEFNGISDMTFDALERLAGLEAEPSLLIKKESID